MDPENEEEIIEGSGEIWNDQDDFENRILKDSAYFMSQSLKAQKLTLLVGWAVLIGIILLVALVCLNYFIWKARRPQHQSDNLLQSKTLDFDELLKTTKAKTVRQQSISLPSIPLQIVT